MRSPLLCRECNEPIHGRAVHGRHADCYTPTGLDRFREAPPGARPRNVRRIVRMERVDDCRLQCIWEDS